MAKKWPGFRRVDEPSVVEVEERQEEEEEEEENEEIDVVGDSPAVGTISTGKNTVIATYWGPPSSPTAGTTAPTTPPHSPEATRGSTMLYNGE
jgi:hypothetical protein